ncbi:MAG TPA: type II secretion system F family protein [Planctomycetota bacterium]|nr:type II secretion system F family protein [Planctomycetota bacterium]
MPIYSYRARDLQGQLSEGIVEVPSEEDLARRLDSQGLILTKARRVKSKTRGKRRQPNIGKRELVTFTYNLQTIYSAGIPVVQGLEDLSKNAGNTPAATVASAMAEEIRAGANLSEAMAKYPQIFPPVYTSVVAAGESAGEAGPVLKRLAEYNQWLIETKGNVLRALTYPLILMTAVAGLVTLLLVFLVPRILTVMSRTGAKLPLPTRMLLWVSNFMTGNWMLLLGGAIALAAGFIILRRTPRGRLLIDSAKLKIPVAGPLLRKVAAARFTNTVSMLYRAGIGTVQCLETAEQVMGNARIARSVREARERVVQGDSLGEALRQTGGFQPLVVRMICLGEQTGTLGDSLDHVSTFYDREIPQTIKSVLNLLEPAMIVGSGLCVGFILLCTFLPIFQLAGALHR